MEFIDNVNKEEYEKFVYNHPTKSHFMQSYAWGEVSRAKGFQPHYIGLKENDELVATALILEKKLVSKYCYFYIPRGFVTDFENKQFVLEMTKALKTYGKKHHAIFIAIDPDIPLQSLDKDGNVIKDGKDHYWLVDYLKEIGYHHHGFNQNFENREPRYTFRLDLTPDIEEIRKQTHPTTRNIINRGNPYHLNCFLGTDENIADFYTTMQETAKREKLTIPPIEYYQTFYHILHNFNMSDLYVVRVNIENLTKIYRQKKEKIEQDFHKLESGKQNDRVNKQKKELQNQLDKVLRDLKKIELIDEKELVLSSMITVKYHDKVWTVHGGNHSLLRELNANYFIYWNIIEDAKKNGFHMVDFFGTTGNPDPQNPIYGIHLFKKRLGGEYCEFIGEFDLILNKPLYFFYEKIWPKLRKFKKQ